MILKSDESLGLNFHFYLTPVGWCLVAMGSDPFYRNDYASTWIRQLSAQLKRDGSDRYRPVWHMSRVGQAAFLLMWENDLDMPADACSQIVRAVRSIDRDYSLGLEAAVGEFLCLSSIQSGSVLSLTSPGVYSNLEFQPRDFSMQCAS